MTLDPATAVGLPLSPRDVVLELRETAHDEAPEGLRGVLGALTGARAGAEPLTTTG